MHSFLECKYQGFYYRWGRTSWCCWTSWSSLGWTTSGSCKWWTPHLKRCNKWSLNGECGFHSVSCWWLIDHLSCRSSSSLLNWVRLQTSSTDLLWSIRFVHIRVWVGWVSSRTEPVHTVLVPLLRIQHELQLFLQQVLIHILPQPRKR